MRRVVLLLLAAGCVSGQTTGFFGKTIPKGTGVTNGAVLTAGDVTYLGYFTLPTTGTDFGFSNGILAFRNASGTDRLFITGRGNTDNTIFEVVIPAGPYSGHPRATTSTAWGDLYDSKRLVAPGNDPRTEGLMYYGGHLWWAYGAAYAQTGTEPSVGFTDLNDASPPTHTAYGPWRTTANGGHTRGYMALLPSNIGAYYGSTLVFGGHSAAGNANSPWGISIVPVALGSSLPTSGTPTDTPAGTIHLTTNELTQFDVTNREPLATSVKWCSVNATSPSTTVTSTVSAGATSVPVADTSIFHATADNGKEHNDGVSDTTGGSVRIFSYTGRSTASGAGNLTGVTGLSQTITSGTSIYLAKYDTNRGFTTATNSGDGYYVGGKVSSIDMWTGGEFINLANGKQGYVSIAAIVDTLGGVDYGDADELGQHVVHISYRDYAICPHNQTDPTFQATGDAALSRVFQVLIFDQTDILHVAQGSKDPLTLAPTSRFAVKTITGASSFPAYATKLTSFPLPGMAWDPTLQRLYVTEYACDTVNNEPWPCVHVFQF